METNNSKKRQLNVAFTVPAVVLDEVIGYIEKTSLKIDWEWGYCRTIKEIKDDKDMPDIYYKLTAIKNGG